MSYFIPPVTSEAGACLTLPNWHDAGVRGCAYHLDVLLMKPGLALFNQGVTLAEYSGFQGQVVLNAAHLLSHKGAYQVRSIYDGSLVTLDIDALMKLITQLKPTICILPHGCDIDVETWRNILMHTQVFELEHSETFAEKPRAVYRAINHGESGGFHPAVYVQGSFTLNEIIALLDKKNAYIESDSPALAGLSGHVYSQEGMINLHDAVYEMDYACIDERCLCQTCQSGLTRAYLHHLLVHTPLLATRLTIQHNVFFLNNLNLSSSSNEGVNES